MGRFDTTELTPTSDKRGLRWRDTALTLIWLRDRGPITVAHTIADKLEAVTECGKKDRILAVRQVQYPMRQEVMVVDNLAEVEAMLRGAP